MRHAVIMAGGSGTRLWPLSRKQRPKQLLRLFGGKSLLRQSYERLAALLQPEVIYVITIADHLDLVHHELPEVPEENLFGEPCGRDTVNAVGLAAAIIHLRDPDGVMGVFTADHIITPLDRFTFAVDSAFQRAEENPDALITIGVIPAAPETGFGYVRRGAPLGNGVYRVDRFVEKPDLETARRYVAGGDYYWNSGMFAWRIKTILDAIRLHLPESFGVLTELGRAWGTAGWRQLAEKLYPGLKKISVDFAIMEKAERVLVVEMDCRWCDVGSWSALATVLSTDAAGNVQTGRRVIHVGSRGVITATEDAEHLIATIGVDDLVIIHSADATLVCRKGEAQAIRDLVAKLQTEWGERYL
ncbi:MAG: mannose-1-phosphate guanylyltransferase [Planctomycetota bacterium]